MGMFVKKFKGMDQVAAQMCVWEGDGVGETGREGGEGGRGGRGEGGGGRGDGEAEAEELFTRQLNNSL